MRATAYVLLMFSSLSLAAQGIVPQNYIFSAPPAMMQCESDQCTRGGGGAVWTFQGQQGQAMWHFGAIANLTIQKFDGHTIVIHREDPNPSYSSPRFADMSKRKDGVFFADYAGTIHGNRIDGTVVWNGNSSGTWYATIPEQLCSPFAECPLDAQQLLTLGQNSLKAKLYSAAYRCFKISADQGNASGQNLAGTMLRDGVGTPPNTAEALNLLKASAAQNNSDGELSLSQTYEYGIGVPKDLTAASFWKDRAVKRIQEIREQQREQQLGKYVMGGLLAVAVIAILTADTNAAPDASAASGQASKPPYDNGARGDRQIQMAREQAWFREGGGTGGPPSGWSSGQPTQ